MGEARNGRFSVFGDLIYTKLSADDNTPHGLLATIVDVDTQTFPGLLGGSPPLLRTDSTG